MVRQEQLLECKCFLKPFEMTSQVMFLYEVLYRKWTEEKYTLQVFVDIRNTYISFYVKFEIYTNNIKVMHY